MDYRIDFIVKIGIEPTPRQLVLYNGVVDVGLVAVKD